MPYTLRPSADRPHDTACAPASPGVTLEAGRLYRTHSGAIVRAQVAGDDCRVSMPEGEAWGRRFTMQRVDGSYSRTWWYAEARRGAIGVAALDSTDPQYVNDTLVEDVTVPNVELVAGGTYRERSGRIVTIQRWGFDVEGHQTFHIPGSGVENNGVYTANLRGRYYNQPHHPNRDLLERVDTVAQVISRETTISNTVSAAVWATVDFAAPSPDYGAPIGPTPVPTPAPRFPIAASSRPAVFKALFGSDSAATRGHRDLWNAFCSSYSPSETVRLTQTVQDLAEAMATPANDRDATVYRNALAALGPIVARKWAETQRNRHNDRMANLARERREAAQGDTRTLGDMRDALHNAQRWIDSSDASRAACRSLTRVNSAHAADPTGRLHNPLRAALARIILREGEDRIRQETHRITVIRRERSDRRHRASIAASQLARDPGYYADRSIRRKACRQEAIRSQLRTWRIDSRAATALANALPILGGFLRMYGEDHVELPRANRAAFRATFTNPAFSAQYLADLRARFIPPAPPTTRTASGRQARRPSIATDRQLAIVSNDAVALLLTDPRFIAWAARNTNNPPLRLRMMLGAVPASAGGAGAAFTPRAIGGYHGTRRPGGPNSRELVGIEIETCFVNPDGGREVLAPRGWIVEDDSSIRARDGERTTEIVSPPRKWDALIATTRAWFDAAAAGGWKLRGGVSRGCGLHITSSMPSAAVEPLRNMLQRMHRAGKYKAFTGRTSETSFGYADPNQSSGKYSPVNVRREGLLNEEPNTPAALVELRAFTGPTGDPDAYMMRLAMGRLIFAISNANPTAWESATAATDFLPPATMLPPAILAEHGAAITYWRNRIRGTAQVAEVDAA